MSDITLETSPTPEATPEKPVAETLPAEQLITDLPQARAADFLSSELQSNPRIAKLLEGDFEQNLLGLVDVPEDETVYEHNIAKLEDPEVQKIYEDARTPEFETALKKLAKEAGLTKAQYAALAAGYESLNAQALQKTMDDVKAFQAEREAQVKALKREHFGAEGDAALALGRDLVAKFVPPAIRERLTAETLSNEAALAIAAIAKGVRAAYQTTDGPPVPTANRELTREAKMAQILEVYANPNSTGEQRQAALGLFTR